MVYKSVHSHHSEVETLVEHYRTLPRKAQTHRRGVHQVLAHRVGYQLIGESLL